MNFKAVLGYLSAVVVPVIAHQTGLPWWAGIVAGAAGAVLNHFAPAPGSQQ
jgi:hypothetical protein